VIIFIQIIADDTFSAFQLPCCLLTLKAVINLIVTRQAVRSIFISLIVTCFALSIGAGLAVGEFMYTFITLVL